MGQAPVRGQAVLTTVSQTDQRGPHAFTATARTDRQRVFRAARRHSRFVRMLRVALPLGSVLAVIAIILMATVLDPLRALAKLPINIGGLVVSGTKITAKVPTKASTSRTANRTFATCTKCCSWLVSRAPRSWSRSWATPVAGDRVRSHLSQRSTVADEAARHKLTLLREIVINSPTYQARLSEAIINVRSGHIVSEKPVDVIMLQGTLNANRLEILNSGEVVRFEQGVTMVLDRTGSDGQGRSQ